MTKSITPWTVAAIETEDAEQQALIMWANMAAFAGINAADDEESYYSKPTIKNPIKDLSLLFAIPNGGLRNPVTANRLKATGVKAGVPDLFLPVAKLQSTLYGYSNCNDKHLLKSWHGMFIEMKKKKGGIISEYQKLWQVKLTNQSYYAIICHGWLEARIALINYLSI